MRRGWTHRAALLAAVIPVAVLAAAGSGSGATRHAQAVSGSITFDGIWTGAEAASFGAVIKAFNKTYPDVKVSYKPVGDNLPQVVSTAVAGMIIAFYQLGYGIAAFGAGPIQAAGVDLSTLFGSTAVVAAVMGLLAFGVTRQRPTPVTLHLRPATHLRPRGPSQQGAIA